MSEQKCELQYDDIFLYLTSFFYYSFIKITPLGFINTFRINRLTNLKRLEFQSLENLTDICLQDVSSKVLRRFHYAKCAKVIFVF
jgi:hypothetical protein